VPIVFPPAYAKILYRLFRELSWIMTVKRRKVDSVIKPLRRVADHNFLSAIALV
jgi:hypothetical protein